MTRHAASTCSSLNLFAALLLLLSFAMLAQRRVVTLVNLLALQGVAAVRRDAAARLAHRQGASVPVRRADAGAEGRLPALAAASADPAARVYWDTEPLLNIPGTMLVGVLVVIFAFGLAQPISRAREHRHAQRDRHRGGRRAAGVPDDDHAPQGDVAGGRIPVDGKRPVLRRDERDLRHADDRRARRGARRAGRDAGARRVLLPDPRAVRQPRPASPRVAEGGD